MELIKEYDYNLGKANVVANALNRKSGRELLALEPS